MLQLPSMSSRGPGGLWQYEGDGAVKGLPDAQLAVLPGTGHGGTDTRIVIDFLTPSQEGTG